MKRVLPWIFLTACSAAAPSDCVPGAEFDEATDDLALDAAPPPDAAPDAAATCSALLDEVCDAACRTLPLIAVPHAELAAAALAALPATRTVTPADAPTVFDEPAWDVFLIMPGDYSAWGDGWAITLPGTAATPRLMRAWLEPGQSRADFTFPTFDMTSSNWFVDGLRFEHQNLRIIEAQAIVINNCEFRDLERTAIRIYDSDDTTIQRSSFHGKAALPADIGGVGVWASVGQASARTHVIGNEFYDLTDGFGLPMEGGGGEVPDTLFAGNHVFLTEAVYTEAGLACAENAIDLKAGTTDAAHPVVIRGNRLHGFRRTDQACGGTGGDGTAIVVHRNARNVIIERNAICDADSSGVTIYPPRADEPDEDVTGIVVRDNAIADIHSYVVERNGVEEVVIGACVAVNVSAVEITGNRCIRTPVAVAVKAGENPVVGDNPLEP